MPIYLNQRVYSFNSKLVRLKVNAPSIRAYRDEFQFQTGAIKSGVASTISCASQLCFNSKLVRLKAAMAPCHKSRRSPVSIPNWCD